MMIMSLVFLTAYNFCTIFKYWYQEQIDRWYCSNRVKSEVPLREILTLMLTKTDLNLNFKLSLKIMVQSYRKVTGECGI